MEYTPMWSSFFCLPMIEQYVTAVMICLLQKPPPIPNLLSLLGQMLPGSPCWETDEACDSITQGECACYPNAWDFGDLVAEAWILEYTALEGVLAKRRMFVCVCMDTKTVDMLRWQMALLHCRATLANRGRKVRRWERRRTRDVSQREDGWGWL